MTIKIYNPYLKPMIKAREENNESEFERLYDLWKNFNDRKIRDIREKAEKQVMTIQKTIDEVLFENG